MNRGGDPECRRVTSGVINLRCRLYVILGGNNIKLRAKRARLQHTNQRSAQPVRRGVRDTWGI